MHKEVQSLLFIQIGEMNGFTERSKPWKLSYLKRFWSFNQKCFALLPTVVTAKAEIPKVMTLRLAARSLNVKLFGFRFAFFFLY